ETLAASLASAGATARRAAAYPHIVASMLNTEVGIGKPPAEPWFATWMKRETGLDAIPDEVKLGPLRIVSPPDAPPIVPADDPAWRYARWLTGEGKGWSELNARIAATMRKQGLDQ